MPDCQCHQAATMRQTETDCGYMNAEAETRSLRTLLALVLTVLRNM